MNMNIYIVHLPHTFTFLISLSLVFRRFGFEEIVIVANGFSYEQIKKLHDLVDRFPYVRILDIPTKRIMTHGEALNYAFNLHQDEFFCFADHDIFPLEPILDNICLSLQKSDVVCMGDRPENSGMNYKGFAASSLCTPSGVPMTTSFFSVYKSDAVRQARSQYNVGFEQYYRKSQLPGKLAGHKDVQVLSEPFLMDTGKAMSLALNNMGKKIEHLEPGLVCHLGGLSGAISRYKARGEKTKQIFEVIELPANDELEEYYRKYQQRHPRVLELKRMISDYALAIILALNEGTDPPKVVGKDRHLVNKFFKLHKDLYKAFGSSA